MDFIRRTWNRITGRACPGSGVSAPVLRAPSRAAAVRAIAGTPAGLVAGRGRRGTVLVIVLGTLALIAVIAVVYAVVGQADRRASAAFVGSVRREEMPSLVRDYVADIVGRDALATYRDGAGDLKREAFDYPLTDPYARSVVVGAPGGGSPTVPANERVAQTFDPAGSYWSVSQFSGTPANVLARGSLGNVLELRVPADPWLAATQATNLTTLDDENVGFPQWDMRDWAHISNVSPDGRFVNLHNLRNNFAAASGFDPGDRDISSRLTLFDGAGLPFQAGTPQIMVSGATAEPNTPAHWSQHQRGAFRPATGMPTIDWSQAENPLYQWADADGDGFFDARWFEFVDISGGIDTPVGIFPPDPTFRWFGAVRIVDLSAAVNLNTATDFLAAPAAPGTNYAAPGGSPADVDIRRLLTGEDVRELAGGVGYDGLRQPLNTGGAVDDQSAQYTGLMFGPLPGDPGWVLAQQVGDAAYNHMRYFLEFGLIAPATKRLEEPTHTEFINYVNVQHSQPLMANGLPINPASLFRYTRIQDRSAWYDTAAGSILNADLSFSEFSIDAEAELLAYRGANNPGAVSTLELVADGRFENGSGTAPDLGSHEYGPFRSSRLATVELAARDLVSGLVTPPGTPGPVNPDGLADLDALTQALVDLRQYVTTLSASRPLRNAGVSATANAPIPPLTSGEQLITLSGLAGAPRALFSLYANAMLPYSGIEETWLPVTDTGGAAFRTLSYGYEGSELAQMVAAHAAVNMADAADADANPTVATVIVENDVRDQLNADYDPPPPAGQNPTSTEALPVASRQHPWAAWVDGGAFDLGPNRIADSASGVGPTINGAYNVYGVEPQPFITEVSAIILYTDAPAGAGGDTENDNDFVTIDGAHDEANSDLAFQAIAFQITNPFDESINLSGNTNLNESRYYLEFGGRYYRIPNTDPNQPAWSGTLSPHETRVFYISSRPFEEDFNRWEAISAGSGGSLGLFIDTIMGVSPSASPSGGDGGPPVALAQFDPETGVDVTPSGYVKVFEVDPGAANLATATVEEVRLWRTVLAAGTTTSGDPAEEYSANFIDNDVLADRFRDESTALGFSPVLAPKLSLTDNEVTNATVFNGTPGPGTPTNYDTGLSVLLWGTARRPSDPEARMVTTIEEVVWIPAYCLEPKRATGYTGPTFNDAEEDTVPRDSLDIANFGTPGNELADTFQDLIDKVTNNASIVPTLAQYPSDKTHNDIGTNVQGQAWDLLLAEFHHDVSGSTARPLAPADLLIAKGVGPSLQVDSSLDYDPRVLADLDKWTTLGEATMLALDYSRGTLGNHVMWAPGRPRTGGAASGQINRGPLDLGHLVIDEYVPFLDANADNGPFDPADDIAYGDAQPLALGVMGQVRMLTDNYGTFRRATPGLININTAPLPVLRTLAMLSPTHGLNPANPSAGGPGGVGGAWLAFTNNNTEITGQGLSSDGASMVQAYRDRLNIVPRGDELGNPASDIIDFTGGRGATANISGVREVPGFRSIAEVLNARVVDTSIFPRTAGLHDIDRLGFDLTRVNQPGFDPVVYSGTEPVDPLADEFDERLVLANAIAGSITVRSDVYAVWFVLHGYRESDCTGLATDDPLIPSVSRRFLMVLDRSGVVNPGDKPDILLFREVPYNPTAAGDGSAI
jgi:hypothetical protein